MEEYLTVDELASRIKFSKRSLYNLIYKKTFVLGKHYFKPTPKKILFKWSEIQTWIERPSDASIETSENEPARQNCPDEKPKSRSAKDTPKSSINI
ncbi:helix-turn-helix transcriptional regulator [Thermodesulfobacteriota bacterium]